MKTPNLLRCALWLVPLIIGAAEAIAADNPGPVEQQRRDAQRQARPQIEQQREHAEQVAQQSLDRDGMAVIEQTSNAIKAIVARHDDEARADIDRAANQINALVARNPSNVLIPVASQVEVIDLAPAELAAIRTRVAAAERAVTERQYPAARVILDGLTSELRVRTTKLSLVTFPIALTDAVRMLDQKQDTDASIVLLTALNTLTISDQVTPVPLLLAQAAVNVARDAQKTDRRLALKSLGVARDELERARALGYAGNSPDYIAVSTGLKQLEDSVRGGGDAGAGFTQVSEKIRALFGQQSGANQS